MQIFTHSDGTSVAAFGACTDVAAPTGTVDRRLATYDPPRVLVVAVDEDDVDRCRVAPFWTVAARHTADALSLIERWRPTAVVIDADRSPVDVAVVCQAAHRIHGAGVLVTMASAHGAVSALRAGCDAILMKPFARNLLAARIGRLTRELPRDQKLTGPIGSLGTSRRWPQLRCPRCAAAGVVSFDHAGHRRDWYACLSCEAVWLARRVE
jgi:CheY-like chemotaxis protein